MSAVDRVRAVYAAIEAADRPEVWITLRQHDDALAEAETIDARVAAGESLPLAGLAVAVKDNIDVAGLPTTAAAPSYAYDPPQDATAVARLRAAGAIAVGKTNMDQFATGLVGTRSPHGAVRSAWDPARISGGSSAGSAVAVALGLVDLSLGTDTAGSGRVPAALNGIVGVKPTRGLIPCTGIVPACRSLDCVTVFARSLDLAEQAVAIMSGPDGTDPLATLLGTRPQRERAARLRLAIPLPGQVEGLDPGWTDKFKQAVATFRAVDVEIGEVDISPMLEAATLLYGGTFVAERYTAVGEHIAAREELIGQSLDPVVARIIMDGARYSAAAYFAGQERLDRLAAASRVALDGFDALLTPTTTMHPTIEQVAGDPVAINSALGKYTNFCNLLDMASLAVPAGTVSGLPFGVMLTGPAGSDGCLVEIARLLEQAPVELLVVGAHLSGMSLNHELLSAGGTLVGSVATAREYQLYALETTPAKPGLVRGGTDSIAGELWRLPAAGFARFMTGLAAPMAIGQIRLDDGREVLGFLCEPAALPGAADITSYGGWRAWHGS